MSQTMNDVVETNQTQDDAIAQLVGLLGTLARLSGGQIVVANEEFLGGGAMDVRIEHEAGGPWVVTAVPFDEEVVIQ